MNRKHHRVQKRWKAGIVRHWLGLRIHSLGSGIISPSKGLNYMPLFIFNSVHVVCKVTQTEVGTCLLHHLWVNAARASGESLLPQEKCRLREITNQDHYKTRRRQKRSVRPARLLSLCICLRSIKAKYLHINSPTDRFSGAELLYLYIIYLYIYKEPACVLCSYLYECCVVPSFWSLCLCRIPQEYVKRTMNTKEKPKKSSKVDTNAINFS